MTDTRTHWDTTYTAKAETQVSWYQPSPQRSLELIKSVAPNHSSSIIDVGGGASRLVDELRADGYSVLPSWTYPRSLLAVPKRALEHHPVKCHGSWPTSPNGSRHERGMSGMTGPYSTS